MAIELVTQFSSYVDEQFSTESKKSMLTNQDFGWDGAHSVKIYKATTAKMNDYDRAGTGANASRYGKIESVSATTEEMMLKRDRSFTVVTDALDENETKGVLGSATMLARQIREVVIPEVDTYTYGVMCAEAGHKPAAVKLTEENIYTEMLKGSEALDNSEVPETGRILMLTPETYTMLKKCKDVIMETDIGNELRLLGVLAMLDGCKVIKVPANRVPAGFGFMIAHPCATVAPTKLESYMVHHNPPGISGYLLEGRVCYDAFVLDNKASALYYQAMAADGLTVASTAGSASGKTKITVTPDKAESNSYRYKVDVAVPAIGEDCSDWSEWDGSADIAAANGSALVVAEVDSNGMAVKAGSVAVTAKA